MSPSPAESLLAIDPGPQESAYVVLTGPKLERHGTIPNQLLLQSVRRGDFHVQGHLAIEMVASYGMAVGAPVFETCVWIGRFIEAWQRPFSYLYRQQIKTAICHNVSAGNANIRRALIDRWGGIDQQVIGTKKKPGPLYGVSGDAWAALAVAVAYQEGVRSELKVGVQ